MEPQKSKFDKVDFEGLNRTFESSDEVNRTIFEFNHKLKTGTPGLQAYQWLAMRQKEITDKYGRDFSYQFLYPEMIGPIPDTYEEWRAELEKYKPKKVGERFVSKLKLSNEFKQKAIEKFGEEDGKKFIEKVENLLDF